MQNRYIDTYTIGSYQVDFKQELSPISLFMFLQETAWRHVNSYQLGWKQMQSKNQFWVLSKMEVKILRPINWEEHIQVETWGKKPELLTAYRDFLLYDENQNVIVKATSSWHILDVDNRRPMKMNEFAHQFPIDIENHALPTKPRSLVMPNDDANILLGQPRKVYPSDIDVNNHVNNTQYIRWALDELDWDFQMKHRLQNIVINFCAEAKINDVIYVKTFCKEHIIVQEIIRQNDDKILAIIETYW